MGGATETDSLKGKKDPTVEYMQKKRQRDRKKEEFGGGVDEVEEEETKTFCEKCDESWESCKKKSAQSWVDFKHAAHHVDQDGNDLYFYNDCTNWRKICSAFLIIYTGWAFVFWGLLEAVLQQGTPVLWTYFTVFWVFFFVILAMVVVGHFERLKRLREEEIAFQKAQEEVEAARAAL
eukprot:CAMPEP_0183333882 /NCGR_PEP_ID=MMETSP0164_2-20130417/2652_1 /TAXON_ID=221442 /ORGANISM="Coccolithus pelagicus ssp braarudi, Strain PLY182g" /LENGTH=177 /DNA_ID=CAMNT_0025502911 /DNA_START=46 /DNA_END=579 /DNA_ORIENTATION=+